MPGGRATTGNVVSQRVLVAECLLLFNVRSTTGLSQNTCITAAVGITQQFLYVQTGNRRCAPLL